MHLLINGLSARLGGGKTYLNQLLCYVPNDWQITLLTSGGLEAIGMSPQVTLLRMPKLANPFRRSWWERFELEALAQSLGCDMIFSPACVLPKLRSKRIKSAVIFQNMLPFDRVQRSRYPLLSYRRLRDFLLEQAMTCAMRQADLVIFISAYARDYITKQCGVTPKRSALIPHALDPRFLADNNSKLAALPVEFPLRDEPYFLYVSFLDFYKCQREVIRAYAALRTQHHITTKLVLAGTHYYERYVELVKQDIEIFGLHESVILLGHVPHASLPTLYQHASINLFASITENCPNILMEIMASGRPALVSQYGPMPEIAGDTVTYIDPNNHAQFTAAWADMLRHMDLANANAQRALERARTYRWEDSAQHTWVAMQTVLTAKASNS